jgi:hypothetical protein
MIIQKPVAGAHGSGVADGDASCGMRGAELPRFVGDFFGAKGGGDACDCRQRDVLPLTNCAAHAVASYGLHGNDGDVSEAVTLKTLDNSNIKPATANRTNLARVLSRQPYRSCTKTQL